MIGRGGKKTKSIVSHWGDTVSHKAKKSSENNVSGLRKFIS